MTGAAWPPPGEARPSLIQRPLPETGGGRAGGGASGPTVNTMSPGRAAIPGSPTTAMAGRERHPTMTGCRNSTAMWSASVSNGGGPTESSVAPAWNRSAMAPAASTSASGSKGNPPTAEPHTPAGPRCAYGCARGGPSAWGGLIGTASGTRLADPPAVSNSSAAARPVPEVPDVPAPPRTPPHRGGHGHRLALGRVG